MEDVIKPGDLVKLKSGGPVMTVAFIKPGSTGVFNCLWFLDSALQQGTFSNVSLVKASAEK